MIIAIFSALLVAMSTMFMYSGDSNDTQPWHNPDMLRSMAEQFVVYKNLVNNYQSLNPDLAPGAISDGVLETPYGWGLPGFHHEAYADPNGRTYVWSEVPGAFFEYVYEATDLSLSACRVIVTRQCVSSARSTALLSSADVPAYIATGSTVYAWMR